MARRFKVAQFIRPLEPIDWPDGNGGTVEQVVKNITWEQQELLTDLGEGTLTPREVMPMVMPALLPGRTWDEIKATLDADAMQAVIAYASGKYEEAMKAMEEVSGNAVAGTTAPASPPPTPVSTSSPASPEGMGAPCGTS